MESLPIELVNLLALKLDNYSQRSLCCVNKLFKVLFYDKYLEENKFPNIKLLSPLVGNELVNILKVTQMRKRKGFICLNNNLKLVSVPQEDFYCTRIMNYSNNKQSNFSHSRRIKKYKTCITRYLLGMLRQILLYRYTST
jgi:hypothetical protein